MYDFAWTQDERYVNACMHSHTQTLTWIRIHPSIHNMLCVVAYDISSKTLSTISLVMCHVWFIVQPFYATASLPMNLHWSTGRSTDLLCICVTTLICIALSNTHKNGWHECLLNMKPAVYWSYSKTYRYYQCWNATQLKWITKGITTCEAHNITTIHTMWLWEADIDQMAYWKKRQENVTRWWKKWDNADGMHIVHLHIDELINERYGI